MAERQELEAIERSPAKATALIVDARRTLATCRSIAAKDPKSALLLAWDGIAFPALTAALTLAGYRGRTGWGTTELRSMRRGSSLARMH